MTDRNLFSIPLKLPYSAVSAHGVAKTDWLLDAFQDIAGRHCHDLGISGLHMAGLGLKWVVAQYRVHVHAPLNWLTPFTLSTWRYPWNNLYETRQFSVSGPDGRPLADATGIWILIKSDTGRPVRLDRHLPPELMDQPPEADPGYVKTHPPVSPQDHCTRFRVMFRDLDLNQHVNNAVYLRWALESLPHPHGFEWLPARASISYLKECFYPETVDCVVSCRKSESGLDSHHAILRPDTGEVFSWVSLQWKKAPERKAPHHD